MIVYVPHLSHCCVARIKPFRNSLAYFTRQYMADTFTREYDTYMNAWADSTLEEGSSEYPVGRRDHTLEGVGDFYVLIAGINNDEDALRDMWNVNYSRLGTRRRKQRRSLEPGGDTQNIQTRRYTAGCMLTVSLRLKSSPLPTVSLLSNTSRLACGWRLHNVSAPSASQAATCFSANPPQPRCVASAPTAPLPSGRRTPARLAPAAILQPRDPGNAHRVPLESTGRGMVA